MRHARVLALAAITLTAVATVPSYAASSAPPKAPKVACSGTPDHATLLSYPSAGKVAKALYVVPKGTPKGIVVFDHGYGHTMYSWVRHMERTARTLGVIAVAPDYRGQVDNLKAKPVPTSRGWRVAEGAADTNAAARLFDTACLKGRGHNVLYSVSMGGNTAGLALAARPTRTGGKRMFDQWVDVEGAANVTETYAGAASLAPANPFAAAAKADIEQEMGGTPATAGATFAERTVVNRVDDIAASRITGVVMVHGYVDGLVTHDVSRQLQARLLALKVPVDLTAFVTHSARSESGTTLDGYAPTGQGSPFAGHANETSETQDVGVMGFTKLASLYAGRPVTCVERTIDGKTGTDRSVSTIC